MPNKNEKNKQLKVTDDRVFQRIFSKVGNENITIGFLEKVLGIEIEDLSLDANKRLIGKENDDKISRLDVKAVLKDGTKVIIEMQLEWNNFIPKRFLFYCSKVYTEGLKKNKGYEELKKTIGILIMKQNVPITKKLNKCHTVWNLREKDNPELILTDDFEIHIIELDKFDEKDTEMPEYDWIRFIKEGRNMGEPLKYDKALEEAMEELESLQETPEMAEENEARIDYLRIQIDKMNEKKEEGRKEGIKENKKEVVINMYKKHMKIEDICEVVELSKEEVEKIIEEAINEA